MNDVPAAALAAVMRARGVYRARFGDEPRWAGYAPGRVNLIGEHTDYNGGFVLPMAVDRYCAVAAGLRTGGGKGTLASAEIAAELEIDFREELGAVDVEVSAQAGPNRIRRGDPLSYIAGVIAGYQRMLGSERRSGLTGLNLMAASEVPMGAGLSSSAALEVATACALEQAWGLTLEPRAKVLLCQKAEHEFAGVPCGIMDQCAAVYGLADHALLIDCRSMNVKKVRLGGEAEASVLVVDTRVRHVLADGAYAQRRRACERAARALGALSLRDVDAAALERGASFLTETEYRCARHVVSENGRTLKAGEALQRGDYAELGRLMGSSHASLRDDFGVSCEELDVLVDAALGMDGVFGAKMTGAGFGGCIVVLAAPAARGVREGLEKAFRERFGRECGVFAVRAAAGAGAATLV